MMRFIQKTLRPILNFLIERYFPDSCFYGHEYLDVFKKAYGDQKGPLMGHAAQFIIGQCVKMNADEFSAELTGLTVSGQETGDWLLTIKHIGGPSFIHEAGDQEEKITKLTIEENYETGNVSVKKETE